MSKGIPCHGGMSTKNFERFDMVLSGHFHTKSSQNNIHYLGCQMEFFWSDCDDKKYFHILDTETRELTPVHNPLTIHKKIYYDHENIGDWKFKDMRYLDDQFVKIIVTNKGDPYEFERFVDRVQNQKIHELKIAENFEEFRGAVNDENIKIDDTETLVNTYVDNINTDLDKNRIKREITALMKECRVLKLLDHYRLKGWCNLKSALLPKDITNLKYYGGKVVKEYLDSEGGKPKWRGVHTASMYDKHLWYFYTSGMMLDIAQNLLETQTPWLFNDQLVWKMPESGFGFAPHTDNTTGVRIWNKTINCLVILDDINIENGGLMVRNRDNGNWVSPTLKQGDILCIDGDTEHASGENLSDKTRSTYACVF